MAEHIKINKAPPHVQYTANGAQIEFTYEFPIFINADLEVYLDAAIQQTGFAIVGAGNDNGGRVTFDTAPEAGVRVTLARRLDIMRTSDFQESGEFRSKVINDELDYLTASLQQVADDQKRSLHLAITESTSTDVTLPTPEANKVVSWNSTGNGFVNGPTADEVASAQAYATGAQSSASNAAVSETNAASSAFAAANSATAAATAAASNMYASNENKSTDFSVLATDDGKQFLIDTSAGDVTVTLPEGSMATDGFRIALGKTSADNNLVIVNRTGTDTINGGSSWQFSVPHGQSVITLDTTPAPDTWFAAGVGLVAPVGVADMHENAKPYDIAFAAGFDSTMTAEDVSVQTYAELVMTRSGSFVGEAGYIDTAPSGAPLVIDILNNGTSIYTTPPQFAINGNALSSGTLQTNGDEDFMSGDRITFKVTATGTSVAGAGLRFTTKGVIS